MKKIIGLLLLFITLQSGAQISPFLEKGISGGGLSAGYETSKGYDGIFGNISYSYKGTIDLTVNLYQGYFNERETGLTNPNASDFYYSGSLSWWFLREKPIEGIDVKVALTLGYEADDYTGFTVENGQYNGYSGGWAGVNFNVGFNLPKKWTVQTIFIENFGFGYDQLIENNEAKKPFYYGVSSYVGASLVKKMNNGNSLVATFLQGVATYNDGSQFQASVGYIFALN